MERTTNFIYQLNCFEGNAKDIKAINDINSKNKIKDRLERIKMFRGEFKFITLEQDVFRNNLVLIDSLMPDLLAETLKISYTTSISSVKELTEYMIINNPLNFDIQFAHPFYKFKIKRFLTEVALGMTPSKEWKGVYDSTKGYLIIKENGDLLSFHTYNRNQFEDYLFNNTKLETANSTRHEFGKIYQEGVGLFIKLNLQIRFN